MKARIVYGSRGLRYYLDGVEVSERKFRKAQPPVASGGDPALQVPKSCSAWPILSDALAVHPKQIEEAMERDRRHGIQTDYAEDGRAILRDRAHRREMMRSLQVHDNNGGYGDG